MDDGGRRRFLTTLGTGLTATVAGCGLFSTDAVRQQAKLVAEDRDATDAFGSAVALADDVVLVGAPWDDDPNGALAGSVYAFERGADGWGQTAKLTPDDGDRNEEFGNAIDCDGDRAVVGAYGAGNPNGPFGGAAYVFERGGGDWGQAAKLAAADGDSKDAFGTSVALDGDTVLAGAPENEDPYGEQAGSAYVFVRGADGWRQQAKLLAADGDREDRFGTSVALDSETAMVGALWEQRPNEIMSGAVYVFERSDGAWRQTGKLTPNDGDSGDFFSRSIALDGDTALVGADSEQRPNGPESGAAYRFQRRRGTWRQVDKLVPTDGGPVDFFGGAVALADGHALVGAWADEDPNGRGAGAAYLYERGDDWTRRAKLAADDGDRTDNFGIAVALDEETAVVGARWDEHGHSGSAAGDRYEEAGSAYVFDT